MDKNDEKDDFFFESKAEYVRLRFAAERSINQVMSARHGVESAAAYMRRQLSNSRAIGYKYALKAIRRIGLKAVIANIRGMKHIRRDGSFDIMYYICNYPDVMETGMDIFVHYIWFGGYEGNDPNTHFCSAEYLKAYPDVEKSGINPYVHYYLSGRKENRKNFGKKSFDHRCKGGFFESVDYNANTLQRPIKIAFAVTSSSPETGAGDFFTAKELAHSLEKFGCEIKYLDSTKDWYNIGTDVDIFISMLDHYDLDKAVNFSDSLITIAWARNWFDRWCNNTSINDYTLIFASSKKACEYMNNALGREIMLFPIATNQDRFNTTVTEMPEYISDYVFTGSCWNSTREITNILDPQRFPYRFKLFGKNWEKCEQMAPYNCGFLRYEDMPKVYSSTRIVIDDANIATKKYGAVNSRVYDAIAAGKLVITNGTEGAAETFNGILPCFSDKESFEKLLTLYMENDEVYKKKIDELRRFVLENHTYDIRAHRLFEIVYTYYYSVD